jgi:hypothetical protein
MAALIQIISNDRPGCAKQVGTVSTTLYEGCDVTLTVDPVEYFHQSSSFAILLAIVATAADENSHHALPCSFASMSFFVGTLIFQFLSYLLPAEPASGGEAMGLIKAPLASGRRAELSC